MERYGRVCDTVSLASVRRGSVTKALRQEVGLDPAFDASSPRGR
jgi:hypothetical protein